MHIKAYRSKRFAGIRNVDLEFERGLNVILGPNESGKSTIVDGIYSTLFKNISLRKNNNSDKDFSFKFMPKPSGDFIDGQVTLGIEEAEYEISKEWGSSEKIEFIDSDGSIIKDEKDINHRLFQLMSYGESTYENIVFAKQRDLKMALKNIISNSQVTDEINDLLRRSMMELEGVSIDKLEKDIEEEIEKLYKRWDREKNYPQNNRGPSNPYLTGLGEILKSFYKKEDLLTLMEETEKNEREFEEICKKIQELEKKIEPLEEEKTQLEKIEDDVNRRSIVEMEIDALNKELVSLMDANKNWPRTEQSLEQYSEKEEELRQDQEKLEKEKDNIEKLEKREKLEEKLKLVEEIQGEIEGLVEELSLIKKIEKTDLDSLSKLEAELLRLDTSMKASKMLARLVKEGQGQVYIKRDLGAPEVLEAHESFEANGIINISYRDEFEIEIKTGDIDFEDLNKEYKRAGREHEELLEKLDIRSLEEGKLNFEKIKTIKEKEKSLKTKKEYILADISIVDLKKAIEELSHIRVFRQLEEIGELLKTNRKKELELLSDKKSEEEKIKGWKEKFGDYDNLFNLIIDKKTSLKEKESDLDKLKALPKEFKSGEEFREKLRWIKQELKASQEEMERLTPIYYEIKGNISDLTYEEVSKEYKQAEMEFESHIKRGEKFLEIQRVFLETKEKLSDDPMESLVQEFARLLEIITLGDYEKSHIDEDFNIRLKNSNGSIPIELLSAGTYDSVALALRFSLLKHIFEGRGGYLILDDCLVDLDPRRKLQSIDLINEFAKDFQIIFTTCDPHTAELLGGNLIEV